MREETNIQRGHTATFNKRVNDREGAGVSKGGCGLSIREPFTM
jgi:hypothetical protein